jgi:hypothetical protein
MEERGKVKTWNTLDEDFFINLTPSACPIESRAQVCRDLCRRQTFTAHVKCWDLKYMS